MFKENRSMLCYDFPIETLGLTLQNGLIPETPDIATETMLKLFNRINYGLNGIYNLTLSMRADGSSDLVLKINGVTSQRWDSRFIMKSSLVMQKS